jgi:hypothetical protein
MKFVHIADLQLGKAFGRFDAVVRAALTEPPCDAIDTIGARLDPRDLDAPIVYSNGALLDLKIEILTEAAERMQGIVLTRRDGAFRHIPANRLLLTEISP